MPGLSGKPSPDPVEPSGSSKSKKSKTSIIYEPVQHEPSQISDMADESNYPAGNEQSDLHGAAQSVFVPSSTKDNLPSVSTSSGESETSLSRSSNSITATQKRKVSSPSSWTSSLTKRTKVSDESANDKESEVTASASSSASDRDESCDDTDNERLSDTEGKEILRVESETPQVEAAAPASKSNASERTPLPNSGANQFLPSGLLRTVKRGNRWSEQEETFLMTSKEKGWLWDDIAAQMPGRSSTGCRRHYTQTNARATKALKAEKASSKTLVPRSRPRRGRWTAEETDKLRKFRAAAVDWAETSKQLSGRTMAGCRRKWQNLNKKAAESSPKPPSTIMQSEPKGVAEGEGLGGGSDEVPSENDMIEEKPKRDIVEDSYSSESDGVMSEDDVDVQEQDGEIQDESVVDEDVSDTSSESEEDVSDSESEDEAEKKRQHATFFLKR